MRAAKHPTSHPPKSGNQLPCGLYVHLPYCETKCGYCDFYSVALKNRDTSPLVQRVIRELSARVDGSLTPIRTIFCGGGTPTLLPVDDLAKLMRSLKRVVQTSPVIEFTVEANPATVDDEKTTLLIEHGVTRVSMGAQSFFPEELATLERIHSPDDIAPSVRTLRNAGVPQINLDLIFGIPGQTLDTWRQSLTRAMELEPDHIACYGLTYEPGTPLTAMRDHHRITPCDENLETDLYLCTIETLGVNGYAQYEISNFARPGCQCQHNLLYWRNQDFIGVGPSAAGCANGRRYKNIADIAGYVRLIDENGHAEVESEDLDPETLMIEMIMMQMRLLEGLSIEAFRSRTGADPLVMFAEPLERLGSLDLVVVSDSNIAMTDRGRLVADFVIRELTNCTIPPSKSLTVLNA